jgi:hypothetical protein
MAACPAGISLTDSAMCGILNASVTQQLPADIRPAPTPVSVESMPTNLQTAIADCDGYSACKFVGYDFFADQSQQMFDTNYVVDTYNTSGENAVVLVKKDKTIGTDGKETYTAATPPPIFVQPPGYSLLDTAIGGTIASTPTVRNQEECAQKCDDSSTCTGFNFSARSSGILSQCELFNDTSTKVVSDNKFGFEKRSITNVSGGQYWNTPANSDFGNQGRSCKNAMACNTEIARIINNVPNIPKFSTRDLDACSMCPPRSFNRDGYTVTNEIGVSVRTENLPVALNMLRYETDGSDATHIDITSGYYSISKATPGPVTYSEYCLLIPVSGKTDQFYILTYSRFNWGSQLTSYPGYTLSGEKITAFKMSWWYFMGQPYAISSNQTLNPFNFTIKKFSLLKVPYVTNGFIFMDISDGKFLRLNGVDRETDADIGSLSSSTIDGPPVFSKEYNDCVFILNASDHNAFFNRARSVNWNQNICIRHVKKPDGSNYMFAEDNGLRVRTMSTDEFNNINAYNYGLSGKFIRPFVTTALVSMPDLGGRSTLKTDTTVDLTPLRTINLPDFWTFMGA